MLLSLFKDVNPSFSDLDPVLPCVFRNIWIDILYSPLSLVHHKRRERLRTTGRNRVLNKEKQDGKNKMAKFAPIDFLKQVRSEARKVTWPTRQETIASTIAVFIMVIIASIFLFAADQVLAFVVEFTLGLGR